MHTGTSCFIGMLCIAYMLIRADAEASNCLTGSACNICPDGHFKMLNVNNRDIKVCCDGYIAGDCWKRDQCSSCDSGRVGNINSIPVCCANCEASDFAIGGRSCSCLHNGK